MLSGSGSVNEVACGLVAGTGVRFADGLTGVDGIGVRGGVTSVEGEISTSSASRYHFRRRV